MAAGREVPVVTGELMMGYVKKWKELKDSEGFSSYGQNNPPGIGSYCTGCPVLECCRVWSLGMVCWKKENFLYYNVKDHVTNDNLDEYFDEYQFEPDAYFIDEWLTEEELDALFK